MKRTQPKPREVVSQMLNSRLVTNRRIWIGVVAGWFRRVFTAVAVDVIELFEEISGRPTRSGARHRIPRALESVLAEIDEIAKSTFRSITLDTMLMLASRLASERVAERAEGKSAPVASP